MRWAFLTIFCMTAVALMAAMPAMSATQQPAGMMIGVVDLSDIAEKYVGYQKAMQALDGFVKVRADIFSALQGGIGLSQEEFDEYQRLSGSPVKVNTTRITELEGIAKKNLDAYDSLQAKANRTADEQTQFDQLDKNVKIASARLSELRNKYTGEVQGEQSKYTTVLIDQVNKAVSRVAESKKLSIVISRTVQTSEGTEKFVLWGGTDITTDVLTILNTEFKDTIFNAKK